MKRILFISVLILILAAGYGHAQMGTGMMGGQDKQGTMGSGMMGGQQGQMGQSGMMMQDQEMSGGMMQMMHQMGSMMQRMSGMIEKGMGSEDTMKMRDLLKDLSKHMSDMSDMMGKSDIPHKDMQMLQQRMMETEKNFNMLHLK